MIRAHPSNFTDYDSDEWEVGSDEDCEGHQSRLIYGSEDARDAQVFAVAMFPFVAETHDVRQCIVSLFRLMPSACHAYNDPSCSLTCYICYTM